MYPYNVPPNKKKYNTQEKPKPDNELTPDKSFLEMLMVAIADELGDAEYYGELAAIAASAEDAEVIRGIQLDEQKHAKMFAEIYTVLTGETPKVSPKPHKITNNATQEYARNVFSELEAVEFYRKIYFAYVNLEIRDMIFEIITDEQAHAIKSNFLFAKNQK